ncbi:AMP-binding protein [Herbiconiux sp.]|uniref:class I adenylate-forming enzyme family protein n=1 Tax=Herbiconiux sp. TaxID=1871186 RepID=UPI0025C05F2C|nr:AMP-binding protein [Herbiconiux sp.]
MESLTASQRGTTMSVKWILGDAQSPSHLATQDRTAVLWEHGERSYRQLRERALNIARWLREQGLQDGDRVAGLMYNRGEIFDIYFACALAGLTYVPINFRLHSNEVTKVFTDCEPKAVFVARELADVARGSVVDADLPGCSIVELEDEQAGVDYDRISTATGLLAESHDTDIQVILYTSGSTGTPKGVVLTHDNVMTFAMQQAYLFEHFDRRSVTMLTGPMYNQAAINEQSLPTFVMGATVAILPSRGWTPDRMIDHIDGWQVTHTIIYPSMIKAVLAAYRLRTKSMQSLKFVLTGGENLPPVLIEEFLRTLPDVHFLQAFGSSESGFMSVISNEEMLEHPGSVGQAAATQTFYIGDLEGNPLPLGETGEIWTRGPGTSSGYWRAPELTASTFREGWCRMGDLGRIDEEGYLYLAGRSKDMIISKGQNIYPAEIENALRLSPDVADVAVVGLPDDEFGEIVCAAVVLEPGARVTAEELIDFSRDHIASFKKPRRVEFFETLPRNPSQKVLKDQVLELVIERTSR